MRERGATVQQHNGGVRRRRAAEAAAARSGRSKKRWRCAVAAAGPSGPGPVQARSRPGSWVMVTAGPSGGDGRLRRPELCARWRWRLVRCARAAGPSGGSVRWRRLVRVIVSVARPRVELWRCWPGPASASDGGVQRRGWSEPAGPGHRQRQKRRRRRTKASEAGLIRAAATAAAKERRCTSRQRRRGGAQAGSGVGGGLAGGRTGPGRMDHGHACGRSRL